MSLNALLSVPNNNYQASVSRGPSPYKGKSRQGDPNAQQPPEDPMKMMAKEKSHGLDTMKNNLSKEREYERIYNQLKEVFMEMDMDRNEEITEQELVTFLNVKTNGRIDTGEAQQIFRELDEDGSGLVKLDEFVSSYFDKQAEVKERILILDQEISDSFVNRDKLILKLKELKKSQRPNKFGFDEDAILSVRVVEARDLVQTELLGKSSPYVQFKFGEQVQKSQYVKGNQDPVWNEVFTFDVENGQEQMRVDVFDNESKKNLGWFEFKLDDLNDKGQRKYDDQSQHDEQFDLRPPKGANQQWNGRLRLIIQYVFSKVKMVTGYINMYDSQIKLNEMELRDMRAMLKHLESPFEFIQGFQMEQEVKSKVEERLLQFEENKHDELTNWELSPEMQARMEQMEVQEKVVEEKVDEITINIAQQLGYDDVPWFQLTWIVLWIYNVLTVMIMFHRPDYINLTICVVALYMMFNTESITKIRFRMLVAGIVLTLIFDLFWFALKHSEYSSDSKDGGGLETGVKRTVLILSYLSFFFRLLVAIVFWKDSMDFQNIIKQQKQIKEEARVQEQIVVVQKEDKKVEIKQPRKQNLYLRNVGN